MKHMEDHAPNLSKQVVWPTPTVPAPHDGYGLELANAAILSFLQDLPTVNDGPSCLPATGPLRPRPAVSIGSWLPLDSLVYHSMAYHAHLKGWDALYVRPAFRQKLNPNFVDNLMSWPASWTSEQTACGPEAMESWLSRARWQLSRLLGG